MRSLRKERAVGLLFVAAYLALGRFVEAQHAVLCFVSGVLACAGVCLMLIGLMREERYASIKSFKKKMFRRITRFSVPPQPE